MDKKLINEDIKNMKYLFGYKPGRVISEQDIDYTTDDYLDMNNDEDFEKTGELKDLGLNHPERLVKHKDTDKIVGVHKHGIGFTPNRHGEELGFEHHPTEIPYGTKFGGTEVGDFDDEDFDYLPDEDNDYRDEMM
jgi:hypothetical protein